MQTYELGATTFICNGNLTGMIRIVDAAGNSVEIPGEDLTAFIGRKMGQWVIGILEGKTGQEIKEIVVRKKKKTKT